MADADNDFSIPHLRNTYDLNSRIMLTAIISLFVVVMLVIILHIYARCVLRRQVRRRPRRFLGGIRSVGLTTSGEPPKTGLDPMVINSLPIFVFKQKSGEVGGCRDDDMSMECAVCLSMLENEEMARLLPNCKHTFHAECIDKWLASRTTCPICRLEVEPLPQPEPEPREGPAMASIDSAAAPPTAPSQSLERVNSMSHYCMEGTSDASIQSSSAKINNGSSSRLSSFRRMLSRERSMRRVQSCEDDQDVIQDLERQS